MLKKALLGGVVVAIAISFAMVTAPDAKASKGTVDYTTWGIGPVGAEEENGCASIPGTWIDDSYMQIWHRHARCDEVRFQQSHGTSRATLEAWLQQVKLEKLAAAYGGNTFVAPWTGLSGNVTWWFDNSGVAHRINDWPTMMSWGLLVDDQWQLPVKELGFWDRIVPKGNDLQYTAGHYYNQVQNYWNDSTYVPIVPQTIKDALYADGHTHFGFLKYDEAGIGKCNSWFPTRTSYKNLDWSYANTLNSDTRSNCNDW